MASKQRKPSPWLQVATVPSRTARGQEYRIEVHVETRTLRCGCLAHGFKRSEVCQHLEDLLAVEILPQATYYKVATGAASASPSPRPHARSPASGGNRSGAGAITPTRKEDAMAPPTVAHPGTNGHVRPVGLVRDVLLTNVDHLLELRGLIKRAQEEERKLTREIVTTLQADGLRMFQGQRAVAILDEQTTLSVDPGLFLEAASARASVALRVSVTAARRILRHDELAAISETTTTAVLRVVAA